MLADSALCVLKIDGVEYNSVESFYYISLFANIEEPLCRLAVKHLTNAQSWEFPIFTRLWKRQIEGTQAWETVCFRETNKQWKQDIRLKALRIKFGKTNPGLHRNFAKSNPKNLSPLLRRVYYDKGSKTD